ncbi:MAG TPA: hypothetical protein DEB17_05165 [Chlorobaculum sp.]|jgi:hypothetical protein|uniref:Uncharacterized protein n=1 Tax=Chlorobaculum tepidum (strain ATCC 49652 / DSM 12025 / NBRC 103806 / TLS) TaxID=194439 RepID=Q8KAV8_CHLTE|nr:hypothetical protein CT2043 [Chlorobaculum tepidum TLS]HBU23374.1 hypothetical protein [Chlorobaculum sp.]
MNARVPQQAVGPFSNQPACHSADRQGFPIVYETI